MKRVTPIPGRAGPVCAPVRPPLDRNERAARWRPAGVAARAILAAVVFAAPGWLAPTCDAASQNVVVLVERDLYAGGEIAAGLGQYLADVVAQGYNPILTTSFATADSAADVRAHLAGLYDAQGLAGAVFVGHLPVATVYTPGGGGISGEFHPCDLFYMDLDGEWTSSGAHGYLPDTHSAGTGTLGPEIWVGWMPTWGLAYLHSGRTEASLLNDYFEKNHAYRSGQLSTPRTGLAYTDDDWDHVARAAALALAVEDGVNDVWNDQAIPGDQTTAANYEWRLANESYEHVLLSAHSSSTYHSMDGTTNSNELRALAPQNLFYHLFACSANRYADYGCIGAEYVFGSGYGLVAVGPTKTGGMMSNTMADYFGPLGEGNTFGDAMLQWWRTAVDPGGHTDIERAWYYGMTILGDPLLVTQAYVPEPSSPALLAVAAAGGMLLALRRRARAG